MHMKKFLLPVLLFTSVLGIQSCSEDFEVAAPYKNITVVYGMLNIKDTAHYVRIQKAFLDENKNALEMAKVADSNFYPESALDVKIKEISNGHIVGAPITLTRVDMNQEGYAKDSGIFFQAPNYAYKFKRDLNLTYQYRLVVENTVTGIKDSADINIIDSSYLTIRGDNLAPTNPNAAVNLNFANANFATNQYKLFIDPGPVTSSNRPSYLEGIIRFRWMEKDLATGHQADKSADFFFSSADVSTGDPLSATNVSFYNFLKEAMKPAPTGVARYMDSAYLYIYGAGDAYLSYINTLAIQSTGLSADQIKPTFTNIKGKDVFGLFTSRTFRFKKLLIDQSTLDSLKSSSRVQELNIQGRTP